MIIDPTSGYIFTMKYADASLDYAMLKFLLGFTALHSSHSLIN